MKMLGSIIGIVSAVASVVFWGFLSITHIPVRIRNGRQSVRGSRDSGGICCCRTVYQTEMVYVCGFSFVAASRNLFFRLMPGIFRGFSAASLGYLISFLFSCAIKTKGRLMCY